MAVVSYAPLDGALEIVAGCGIALKGGGSNHAPMVAEALCALDRSDAVMPWLERYRERMLPRPPAADRIAPADWRSALGRRERFSDWAELFAAALEETPWRAVLDLWAGRLAPGFCAAATQGVIRVGHAVRSLTVEETPARRRELADALASWAATSAPPPTPTSTAAWIHGRHPTVPRFPGFPMGVTSGTYSHDFDLTDAGSYNPAFVTANVDVAGAEAALVAGIIAGKTYLNVHTDLHPGGEIRGFLAPEPGSLILLGTAILGLGALRRRRRA